MVDPDTSAVAEGDVEIGKVFGLQAKIVPVTSSGRWRGRHVVQLSNWGNAPATLRMVASDPDATLGFYVRPDVVDLPLGGTATVRMSVKTRKPFLRGTAVRLPFRSSAEPATPETATQPHAGDAVRGPQPAGRGRRASTRSRSCPRGSSRCSAWSLVAIIGLSAYLVLRPNEAGPGLARRPAAEADLVVEAKGPNAVLVSWEPIDGVETYNLFTVDPESKLSLEQTAVPAGQNGKLVEALQPVDHLLLPAERRPRRAGEPAIGRAVRPHRAGSAADRQPIPVRGGTSPGSASVPPPTTGGGAPAPRRADEPAGRVEPPGGSVPPGGSNPPPT